MNALTGRKFGAEWAGLCASCRHAVRVETPRSVFWRCALAATDPRFEKYPRLPVLECPGYERAEDTAPEAGEEEPGT